MVEASVLEAVQVLFGVSANHIKVLKMEVGKRESISEKSDCHYGIGNHVAVADI